MRKKTGGWRAVVFFAIMGGYLMTAQGSSAESPAGPVVVFPETTFDFGVVLEGKEVAHDFVVQNRGTSELVIQNVQPG